MDNENTSGGKNIGRGLERGGGKGRRDGTGEVAVEAVAVKGGAGNDLFCFSFSMIFHLDGRALVLASRKSPATVLITHLVLRYVSEVLHFCLYVLLLIQPLAGILMSQAYGYPVVGFGWIEMPTIIWHSPSLGGVSSQIHSVTAIILLTVILVHTAAALKHHYIDGDRTLIRMLKGGHAGHGRYQAE